MFFRLRRRIIWVKIELEKFFKCLGNGKVWCCYREEKEKDRERENEFVGGRGELEGDEVEKVSWS